METILRAFPELNPRQKEQLAQLQPLYSEWNQRINLISRKDIDRLYSRHVLHSLAIARVLTLGKGERIMDLGTGGGFPGIPLAILFPQARFWLVDRIGKKILAVEQLASALGLDNVTAVKGRGQDQPGPFDYVVTRAVAPLKDLWTWSWDRIAPGRGEKGLPHGLLALKGGDLREEIRAAGMGPRLRQWPLEELIPELGGEDKYLVFVPRTE